MDKPLIELITNESGDWEVLKFKGEIFAEGHAITNHNWIDLIQVLTGYEVQKKEISDEDMEEGNY